MKALQLQEIGRLELVDVPVPAFKDDQLLIRTGAAVICTSDLNDVRANPFGIHLPVVMGHEGAGTVAAVGKAVKGFAIGDRVATHPVHPCLRCATCRRGLAHLCPHMAHFGVSLPGTFAEYYIVRQDRARRIADNVDFAAAALAEPVCVCLEALERAGLAADSRLLILGDGPFGLLIARLARRRGVSRVVIAGRHDFRLGFAGDAVTINTKKQRDVLAVLRGAADGGEYDAAILAVGSAEAVTQGIELLAPRGRLVVFSAVPGLTPVDLLRVHVKELQIVGACNDRDMLDEAVGLLADPQLDLPGLLTHRFALEQYEQAFDLAAKGREEAIKVAFLFQ
jgi:2-desacetyl-2-hydroxyethyl bacteriochlorophyllide A dehydrogenase